MIYIQYHTFKWPFLGPNTPILLTNTMSTHFKININLIPETPLPGILPSQFISAGIIVLECNIGSGFLFSFFSILSHPGPTNGMFSTVNERAKVPWSSPQPHCSHADQCTARHHVTWENKRGTLVSKFHRALTEFPEHLDSVDGKSADNLCHSFCTWL